MKTEFLRIKVRNYKIVHGFDQFNQEVVELSGPQEWVDKIIAINRIQSITECYIRMHYSHERIIYWEYKGGLEWIESKLRSVLG